MPGDFVRNNLSKAAFKIEKDRGSSCMRWLPLGGSLHFDYHGTDYHGDQKGPKQSGANNTADLLSGAGWNGDVSGNRDQILYMAWVRQSRWCVTGERCKTYGGECHALRHFFAFVRACTWPLSRGARGALSRLLRARYCGVSDVHSRLLSLVFSENEKTAWDHT